MNNNFYNNKIITFKKKIKNLTNYEILEIFNLYKLVYSDIEKKTMRKYNTVEKLLDNYSEIIYFKINNITFGGFLLKKIKNKINKISIILHKNDNYSKQYVYDTLAQLITSIGYMIESDGGVSHILMNYYNIKPVNKEIVEYIFGKEKIINWDNNSYKYDRLTKNHRIIGKQLFGRVCNKQKAKTWANKLSIPNNKCQLTFNNIEYKFYNKLFNNVFNNEAKLNFLSNNFVSYNDLDSESYLSNMIISHKININNIENTKKIFNLSKNGFTFLDIFSYDKNNKISSFLKNIKKKMDKNDEYILNDAKDREIFREKIVDFFNDIKNNKTLFGKNFNYDIAICVDAVPRDTSIKNNKSLFKGINLIHTDIYPFSNLGDTLWSFRNKWYSKIDKKINDIENLDLNNFNNRNTWNNKIVGIYNIWVSLTDGITDNGLTIADFNKKKLNEIVPYKAYRPNSRSISDSANFISGSIKFNENYKWYSKFNMQFGECYIFNTIGTPHSAFKYENGTNKSRKSVELRLIFLKNIDKK